MLLFAIITTSIGIAFLIFAISAAIVVKICDGNLNTREKVIIVMNISISIGCLFCGITVGVLTICGMI
jgi:hypothetical protein